MFLFFLAGLLPNPDGPWYPTVSHCHAWVTAVIVEAVIAAVLKTEGPSIRISAALLDALVALGVARILALLIMIAVLVRRQYALRSSASTSTTEERQGLLENGQGPPASYGGAHDHGHGHGHGHGQVGKPPAGKPRDAQGSGWLDYIAGFRVLFPYLW